MKAKHTPGTWYQSHRPIPNDENEMYATQVYTEDGETIATLSWYPMPQQKEIRDGKEVLVIGTYRSANAQLIAAAPELLEALQMLVEKCLNTDGYNQKIDELYNAQQAIKKAIGE